MLKEISFAARQGLSARRECKLVQQNFAAARGSTQVRNHSQGGQNFLSR